MKTLLDFVALDIETTGFDFQENEIIEIGAVKYRNGEKAESFSKFIKPKKAVPEFIKQLTHITDEQLAGGDTLANALTELNGFVHDEVIVCHNTSFDVGFLNAKQVESGFVEFSNVTLDTLELARMYMPFLYNHKLGTVAEYFGIDLSNAHRAIYDAEATGEILSKLLGFIDENISLQINHRLWEIARFGGLSSVFFLEKVVEHQKKNALLTKKKPKIDFHNRNYIAHKPKAPQDYTVDTIFGQDGVFDKKFGDYEIRKGQIQMAKAVEYNFDKDEYLLVEAGTGVGKSLAYLIPSILYSNRTDKKVVISTNTKNLQEQLFYKDLPTVRDCVDVPFKATLLKGRRNYICEKKWAEAGMNFERTFSPFEAKSFVNLVVWNEFTKTGDISENTSFNPNRDSYVWKKVVADSFFCRGRKCQFYNKCYLMDIRRKADESNLVIINHHLLLADMLTDNSALGKYENLIVDEAHNLPQLAPGELGLSLSYADFSNFFSALSTIRNKFQAGMLINLKTAAVKSRFSQQEMLISSIESTINLMEENKELFAEFFRQVGALVQEKGNYGKLRVTNMGDHPFITDYLSQIILFWQEFSKSMMRVRDILTNVNSQLFVEYDRHLETLEGVLSRIAELHNSLVEVYNPDLKDHAYWLESFSGVDRNYPAGIINYAPLNVNQIMNDCLYSKVKSIVFTSATMAIRGKFKYFAGRMGLDLLENGFVQELVVESPFDYEKQSMVLVAGFLPDPKDRFFSSQGIELIKKSVEVSQVGTMVLFTAYRDLNNAFDSLNSEFYAREIPFFAQGKGVARNAMLKEFKQHKNAVLLGTNSFWEGVDVPGESLSLLILYKLPFMVPSEPIVEAYIEKLEAEGKNSFMHYMMPNALLKYRQGFGRLIRNKSDRGVVLVLDNRIKTKRYGQYFKDTIPTKTVIPQTAIEIYDCLGKWFKDIGRPQ